MRVISDSTVKIDETVQAYFQSAGSSGVLAQIEGRIQRVAEEANSYWLNPVVAPPAIVVMGWDQAAPIVMIIFTVIEMIVVLVRQESFSPPRKRMIVCSSGSPD